MRDCGMRPNKITKFSAFTLLSLMQFTLRLVNITQLFYCLRYQVGEFTANGPKNPRGIESYGITYYKIKRETVRCQGASKSAGCYEFVVNDPTKSYGRKKSF